MLPNYPKYLPAKTRVPDLDTDMGKVLKAMSDGRVWSVNETRMVLKNHRTSGRAVYNLYAHGYVAKTRGGYQIYHETLDLMMGEEIRREEIQQEEAEAERHLLEEREMKNHFRDHPHG